MRREETTLRPRMRNRAQRNRVRRREPNARRARAEKWYFVCLRCNAKWFHWKRAGSCPRCGIILESSERFVPPWQK